MKNPKFKPGIPLLFSPYRTNKLHFSFIFLIDFISFSFVGPKKKLTMTIETKMDTMVDQRLLR